MLVLATCSLVCNFLELGDWLGLFLSDIGMWFCVIHLFHGELPGCILLLGDQYGNYCTPKIKVIETMLCLLCRNREEKS